MEEHDGISPIEEVRLTVSNVDDPTLPVFTFRMWLLGVVSCVLLSFLNTFFAYRTQPLIISMISVQVASLPIGRFMAKVLPEKKFRIPGFGGREWTLNPGPFNMKEHVLISVFANAGSAFGGGAAYAVSIVNVIKAFYNRNISFLASWILVITTQVLGYGWAGVLRKFVVDPPEMWWPSSLVQVSLFRALHEKDDKRMSRGKFFVIALICSFSWYLFPGYLFPTLSSISWVCWAFPNSVTAQQLGSGMRGLGLGSFALDWSVVASYLNSPLITPFFVIVNVFIGYCVVLLLIIPIAYWGFNVYDAKKFPIFSSHIFNSKGQIYNVSAIVNDKFELDIPSYEREGRLHLSIFFSLSYGIGFAAIISSLTHVALFNGRKIYQQIRASSTGKQDIHTRLMMKYEPTPSWWFHSMLVGSLVLSLVLCIFMKDEIQMPWWGLIFASALALLFTLPISIITATTNMTPGLNVITEYVMGIIYPGRPIANVCFKTYGYISMGQAVSFLNDFKLGHYMKIPTRAMFIVQLVGTIIAGTVNIGVAWWLLTTVENICQDQFLSPNSPWTCPGDRVFFDASVIWGLVGPKRIFGKSGNYSALNWFFLGGALGPVIVWMLHRAFPNQKWIPLINLPVLLGATAAMPPATTLNFNCWMIVGTIFNHFIFKYRKGWWQRYNYVLSAALDAGLAFMGVLLYFTLTMENRSITWWGSEGEHCELATCPTAKDDLVYDML
ncbi:oligopeptide transporter 2-like [Pistacia vera]|uniref:oligopeptide transporter 2-like n=1 Tax=Pistacia vera TaxID=55513 RepID=UPI001263B1C8|nr:oligopeptide transporter 2-like [Pistacia vera]